ncbi:hypothetical protein P691DRAFT_107411 [Macrolepiota fuliginosa MF-IS2]|uniref:Uncharacterized protein n=1 Tax=Macrolepiota fuliginosa MF-IS2 TaxID=1400762 RepID=A0A9P5XAQ7_9AGAR|nr:hypothetical protein P691DRAFT_107411 [Macrolepiota fuliginosa MF-IS2]
MMHLPHLPLVSPLEFLSSSTVHTISSAMAITTRAKARQFQEDEFATLRKIDVENINTHGIHPHDASVVTTQSATGHGIHKRWVYPELELEPTEAVPAMLSSLPLDQESEGEDAESSFSSIAKSRSQLLSPFQYQPPRAQTPYRVDAVDRHPTLPASAPNLGPKPPSRTHSSGIIADMDMKFLLHIKKDEDVGEALWRHVGLHMQESQIRQHENHKRAYELIKTRPDLLAEGTNIFARADPKWDADPFV